MKQLIPGRIWHPPNLPYNVRVKKRKNNCEGCILDNLAICPNVVVKGDDVERPECEVQDIIFVKP